MANDNIISRRKKSLDSDKTPKMKEEKSKDEGFKEASPKKVQFKEKDSKYKTPK